MSEHNIGDLVFSKMYGLGEIVETANSNKWNKKFIVEYHYNGHKTTAFYDDEEISIRKQDLQEKLCSTK